MCRCRFSTSQVHAWYTQVQPNGWNLSSVRDHLTYTTISTASHVQASYDCLDDTKVLTSADTYMIRRKYDRILIHTSLGDCSFYLFIFYKRVHPSVTIYFSIADSGADMLDDNCEQILGDSIQCYLKHTLNMLVSPGIYPGHKTTTMHRPYHTSSVKILVCLMKKRVCGHTTK